MKKIIIITMACICILSLSACTNDNDKEIEIPEVEIKIKDADISNMVQTRIIETVDYENVEGFQIIMHDSDLVIPYTEFNEKIQIIFDDGAPDSCELTDYILKGDGTLKYNAPTIKKVDVELDNDTVYFYLEPNVWAGLSSNSEDYESGATIRGFRLICKWDEEIYEYIFVIKSDAY